MNKKELEICLLKNGDTKKELAHALGIHPRTLGKKLVCKGSDFTLSEIQSMIGRYNLTPEDVDRIFFSVDGSFSDPYGDLNAS